MIGWLCAPLPGQSAQQPVAPVGQVDATQSFEFLRPALDNGGKQVQRFLPVTLKIVGDVKRAQVGGGSVLGNQFVERRGKFGCEAQRFGCADRLARDCPLLLDQARKDQATRKRFDRRRYVTADRVEHCTRHLAGVADRNDTRQQQPMIGATHERVGQRADCPVVRDEHDPVCQCHPVAAVLRN